MELFQISAVLVQFADGQLFRLKLLKMFPPSNRRGSSEGMQSTVIVTTEVFDIVVSTAYKWILISFAFASVKLIAKIFIMHYSCNRDRLGKYLSAEKLW